MAFFKFTPDLISKDELEKISVGRNELVQNCVDSIKNSIRNKSTSQILFLGPRGIGKSHTLLRIFYRLADSNMVTAVRLAEEEYSISSLDDLCQRILEVLEIDCDRENVIPYCRNTLNRLKNDNKPVVLFVENLQMLFEQIHPDLGKLRSIIQSDQSLCIVGSALTYFDSISSLNEPFYKFFDTKHLQGLTKKQLLELIKKRLELSNKKNLIKYLETHDERIGGIHLLTGGNPRLVHILVEIVVQKNSLEDLERNLLSLLDQLTPFYQAQMETMTGEQRKLFDTIALSEGPLSPIEIAKRLNNSKPAGIVTQLRRLQKNGLVENVKFTNKKGTRYQIVERLYRIWRELRSTRGANKIKLFVDFMRLWYSRDELVCELRNTFRTIDESYPYSQKRALSAAKEMRYILEATQDAAIFHLYSAVEKLILLNQFTAAQEEIYKTRDLINQEENQLLQKSGNIFIDLVEFELLPNSITKHGAKRQSIIDRIDILRKQKYNIPKDKEDRLKTHMVCESIAHRLISYGDFKRALHYNDIAMDCVKSDNIYTTALNQRAYIKRFLGQYNESLTITDEILRQDPDNVDALSEKVLNLTFLNKQDLAVKTSRQLLAQDVAYFPVAIRPFIYFELRQELLVLTQQYEKSLLGLRHDKFSKFSNHVLSFSDELLHAIIEKKTSKRQLCISLLSLVKDVIEPRDITRGCIGSISTHIKETDALREMFSILAEIFGSDKLEGLAPFTHSLNYLANNDPTILEKLHPEMRHLVIQIVQEMSPDIKIDKEILDSVSI